MYPFIFNTHLLLHWRANQERVCFRSFQLVALHLSHLEAAKKLFADTERKEGAVKVRL